MTTALLLCGFWEAGHPWIAIATITGVFVTLQVKRGQAADLVFLGGLMVVTLCGIITPQQALAGFANTAVVTIAALLAISAGLRVTGVLDWVGRKLLGAVHDERQALRRLAVTLVASSAFVLNTALVAMLMPVVLDWCRRRHISPSRLLLPLSYLTILGGVCTLIGTSTTLVAQGKLTDLRENQTTTFLARAARDPGREAARVGAAETARREAFVYQLRNLSLLEIGYVGLPCAVVGTLFVLFVGGTLLPTRVDMVEQLGERRREYLVEMLVQPQCPLIGQTVEAAGLRHLPGLFLIEIGRQAEVITPVTPQDKIVAHDRLIFTGVVSTIVDLEKIPGLVPAADLSYEAHPLARQKRGLTEVVLSRTSPLIGATVREANFRQRYNAAVVAIHRNGARVTNKIGNVRLQPGDTLLLQTRNDFVAAYRNSRDFYLVSSVEGAEPRRHHKLLLAGGWALLLVLWLVLASTLDESGAWKGFASPAIAAISIAGLMVGTRCMRMAEARSAIDLHTLVTIGAALGLGKALSESGAAHRIAETLVGLISDPYLLLIAMYLLALVFTETITNNAVAAMLIPLAAAVAWESGYNPRPYVIAITLAASLSFVTPIGYQTNLMVMGPGGYRPSDYLRVGVPLAIVVTITALVLIPRVWPLALVP